MTDHLKQCEIGDLFRRVPPAVQVPTRCGWSVLGSRKTLGLLIGWAVLAILGIGLSLQGWVTTLGAASPGRALVKHPGWPFLLGVVGVMGFLCTWPRAPFGWVRKLQRRVKRLGMFYRSQPWWGRVVLSLLALHVLVSLGYFFDSPENLLRQHREKHAASAFPFHVVGSQKVANLEYHLHQYRSLIPPNACVAYRGHWEAMVAAYQLYPRRLYFLPEDVERLSRSWNDQPWLHSKTKGASRGDNWTEAYWAKYRPRSISIPLHQFLADRGIEYLIVFDEDHPELCQVMALPVSAKVARKNGTPGEQQR